MLKVSSRGQYLEILFNGDRKMLHYLSLVDEELEQLDDSLIGERERENFRISQNRRMASQHGEYGRTFYLKDDTTEHSVARLKAK